MDRRARTRVLGLAAAVLAAALLISLDPVFEKLRSVLDGVAPILAAHAILGPLLFIAVSALSAMVTFVSSAVLVPAAVVAWGQVRTAILLWTAWIVGGSVAWALGRALGRPVVRRLVGDDRFEAFSRRFGAGTRFPVLVLFQLSVPSEVPGYVLGTAGTPFFRYLAALALAELPFAIGAVGLGQSLVDGKALPLVVLGAVGVAVSFAAMRWLGREVEPGRGSGAG